MYLHTMFMRMFKIYKNRCPSWDVLFAGSSDDFGFMDADHIALRTFLPLFDKTVEVLRFCGYRESGQYELKSKHVIAKSFSAEGSPRIFISALLHDELSKEASTILMNKYEQIGTDLLPSACDLDSFYATGRQWSLTKAEYDIVAEESEYGSWLLAMGFMPNHFAVGKPLGWAQKACGSNNIALNDSGGLVKGSKESGLMQMSTKADILLTRFDDGVFGIPNCYVEFVERYLVNRALFDGFLEKSADKIMESTEAKNGLGFKA